MAEQNQKQGQLQRVLTLGATTILVVSSVIGSGVYKKVAPMADSLGSPVLVLICWVLAGVISIFGALSNAEVAGMLADSGGEYAYFKRIYGKFMAFLYGWSAFTVIKSAATASIAYVFAQSFNSLLPLPHFSPQIENITLLLVFKPFENFGVKALTILLILSLTWVNSRGLKGGSALSGYITRLMIAGLAVIVITGLIWGGGQLSNLTTPSVIRQTPPLASFDFIKALFGAMLSAFWAFEGWNIIGYVGGEIKNPNRNIPLALFGGMAIIISAYLLVNFTYLYVLPVDTIIQGYTSQNEIAAVAVLRHFAGPPGAMALSLLILLTTFGCTNTTILMPPRIYYAMSRDGYFFSGAASVHPKFNTPHKALWIQALWASLLVLSGSFDQLTDMLVFAAFFFYGATTLGVFILRVKEPSMERPYRVWGYPVVPALFILFCAALVFTTFFTRPREAFLGMLLILTGVPFYIYWNRKKNRPGKVNK